MKRAKAAKRRPGRRSVAESQETRERLLAVAQRLFAQHGYAGTSIRDLGSALGVASSSVLHHVGSKQTLRPGTEQNFRQPVGHGQQYPGSRRCGYDARVRRADDDLVGPEPEYVQIVVREMMKFSIASTRRTSGC